MWFVYLCLAGGIGIFLALDLWVTAKFDVFAYRGYDMLAKVKGSNEFLTLFFRHYFRADTRIKQNP